MALLMLACQGACERGELGPPCEQGQAEDCEADLWCLEGHCVSEEVLHERTAWRCRWGLEGRFYGRTTERDGGCVATSDADCRASLVTCVAWGQCSAPPPEWAPPGSCPTLRDGDADHQAASHSSCAGLGTCVAASDDDCRAARVCAENGRCTARHGLCAVTDEADCQASRLCEINGLCRLVGGRCLAASVADCQRAEACKSHGECGLLKGHCVQCQRSEGCRERGECAVAGDRCVRPKVQRKRRPKAKRTK